MELHEAGKVSNAHKGCYEGVSVATFAAGNEALYGWLHLNRDVAFLPVTSSTPPRRSGATRG